jgi:hypothetical protein
MQPSGCRFPDCMCRHHCILIDGGHPDDGDPFKSNPNPLDAAQRVP